MSQVWWPIMAAGCVIGVDLGGTKLLAGTVDSKLEVHHRAYRLARPDDTGALHRPARRGGRRRRSRPRPARSSRSGSGSRAWSTPRPASRCDSNHLPLRGVAVRDLLTERLGLPVAVDNDANAAMLAEWRCGEARGAQRRDHADARHRHRRRAHRRRAARPRRARRGGRARPHHRRRRRAAVPGQLPEPRLPGGARVGSRDRRARGCGVARDGARQRARARAGLGARRSPARSSPSSPTTAIPAARDVMTLMGERLGLGVVDAGQHLQPRGRGRRRRRDRRRRAAAGARRARSSRARALPINRARRAARVGPLRRRVGDARARPAWRSTWRG